MATYKQEYHLPIQEVPNPQSEDKLRNIRISLPSLQQAYTIPLYYEKDKTLNKKYVDHLTFLESINHIISGPVHFGASVWSTPSHNLHGLQPADCLVFNKKNKN